MQAEACAVIIFLLYEISGKIPQLEDRLLCPGDRELFRCHRRNDFEVRLR